MAKFYISIDSAKILIQNDIPVSGKTARSNTIIDDISYLQDFSQFYLEDSSFKLNTYSLYRNDLFESFQVWHEIAGVFDFQNLDDAIEFAHKG